MQYIRRTSILFAVAAAACLAATAVTTAVVKTCGYVLAAVTGYVRQSLALFSRPEPHLPALPHPRAGLTARERHDLAGSPIARATVRDRWQACPST